MAQKATEHCNQRMIQRASKQNPPSVYHVDDAVLIKVKDGAHRVSKRYRVLPGRIVKRNLKLSKYKIQFQIPGDPNMQEKWFFVSDVISTTQQQKKKSVLNL